MKKLVTKQDEKKIGVRRFYKTTPTLWLKCQIFCFKLLTFLVSWCNDTKLIKLFGLPLSRM